MGTSMSREQKRARARFLRKVVMVLFGLCVITLIADLVCVIILLAGKGKSGKSDTTTITTTAATNDSAVISEGGDSSDTSETTEATTPAPSAVEVKEYLPKNDLAEAYWGPLPDVTEVKPVQHNEIRGIYIAGGMRLDENIELAKSSDINAFVVDLKDEANGVLFNSNNEMANSMTLYGYSRNKETGDETWENKGSYVTNAYDLDNVIKKCHENGIKVIGRIVCFNDLSLAKNHPEMSIKDVDGNTMRFKLESYHMFVNPYDQRVWEFLIDLANEAIDRCATMSVSRPSAPRVVKSRTLVRKIRHRPVSMPSTVSCRQPAAAFRIRPESRLPLTYSVSSSPVNWTASSSARAGTLSDLPVSMPFARCCILPTTP